MKVFLKPLTVVLALLVFFSTSIAIFSAPVAEGQCDIGQADATIDNNTTWGTSVGCPTYAISAANVVVRNNATLTIEAGTTIKFNENTRLEVGIDDSNGPSGTLVARGQPNNPIIFTSNQAEPAPGDWVHIKFHDSSIDATFDNNGNYTGGSIIQHTIIEYAGGDSCAAFAAALCIDNSSPYIDHSIIRNNSSIGIYIRRSSNSRVTNNLITNNAGSAIDSYGSPVIHGNIMSHNQGVRGGGISLRGQAPIVVANTVFSNTVSDWGGGIFLDNPTARIHSNNVISNTSNNGGGIALAGGSSVKISGNIIKWNSAQETGAMDSDVAFNLIIYVIGNIITHNTSRGGVSDDAGIHFTSQRGIINYNDLYSNTVVQDGKTTFLDLSYKVANYNLPDQNSENNWWGTTDEDTIAARILDGNDSEYPNRDRVDFTPYRTSPVATGATVGTSGGNLTSGNVQVTFPANAVPWDTNVTYFDIMTPTEELPDDVSWVDAFILTAFATQEAYTPTMDFEQPVTLAINYTDAGISNENNLNVAYWDPFSDGWKTLLPCQGCSVDATNNRVTVVVDEFSEFALVEGSIAPTAVTMQQIDSQLSSSSSKTWLVAWLLVAGVGIVGLAIQVRRRKS